MNNKIPIDEILKLREFSFPSVCIFCFAHQESFQYIFFDCHSLSHIWLWLNIQNLFLFISDCYVAIARGSSPKQGRSLLLVSSKFSCKFGKLEICPSLKTKLLNWKSCIIHISTLAKLVGNNTKKSSNSSMENFTLLKGFDISINLS